MAGRDNAALQKSVDAEIVGVSLWARARDLDVPITRRWVEEQLDRLRGHPPGCICREPCDKAAGVSAPKVHWIMRCWVLSTARTEKLARR